MQELTQAEMENEFDGGGWLADRVAEALCWIDCHSDEIAAAYVRMYEDGMIGS